MEPFTVTCSTCESRIRVRNPSMVGQLAHCPKCGSMLMLSPVVSLPPTKAEVGSPRRSEGQARIEVEDPDGAPVDSMAVTKEGLAPTLLDLSSTQTGDVTQPEEGEYRLEELVDEESLTAPPIQPATVAAEAWQSEATPHIPSEQWTSDSTNRRRQYLLVGFLGLSGTALAAVLFWGFLQWYTQDRSPPLQAVLPTQPTAASDTQLPTDNILLDVETADRVETADIDTSPATPVANGSAVQPQPPDADTMEKPLAAVDPSKDSAQSIPSNPTAEPAAANVEPAPTQNVADADGSTDTPANADVPTEAAPSLPKQLAAFAPMLQYEIQPQFPDAIEIRSEAPVTAEDLGLTSMAGLPPIPPIDLAAQSQVQISALVIAPLPMAQFVSLWSNVSGVPTVVDIASLAAAAIDRNQKLSLSLVQSVSVGSLIPQLGQELGLVAETLDDGYLELMAPTELIEQKLPSSVSLAGLISDAEGADWLPGALEELFPEQDIAWRIEQGQLLRPQSADGDPLAPQHWFQAVKLIEGWRLAVTGESSLSQYTADQLASDLLQPDDVAGLQSVLQEVTPQSRPVAQVLPRMCQAAGLHAWIDWANVDEVGLGPNSTAVFITAARPLQRVLADYASEFSLVIAILDKQSLWITSNQAYRADPQLFVIPSAGKTAAQWKSQLRPLTPAADGGLGVGSVVVIATPDEQFMLVRCCRPTVSF